MAVPAGVCHGKGWYLHSSRAWSVNHTKETHHSSLSSSTLIEENVLCSEEEYWAKLCCSITIVLSCKTGYLFMLDLDNKKMFGVRAQSGQYIHRISSWTPWCSCHFNISCGPLKSFSRRTHFSKHRGTRSFFYLNSDGTSFLSFPFFLLPLLLERETWHCVPSCSKH